jgi:hypothetical protein
MKKRKCSDWIESYLEYTDNSEPPALFRLWTGISVLAAALQRKCYVSWGMLTFYPNLYVILVGPSGTRKGTAMYPGQALLRRLEVRLAADATTLQALIRRLKESTSTRIDTATGLPQSHSSMTIFSKEFTVFLGYKNDELIADLCDWYDCDEEWTYDTKHEGTDEILGVWVNLIGATTPSLIQSSLPLDAIGGGLTSRIIFVYETQKGKTIIIPTLTEEQESLKELLYIDLEHISMLSGQFKFTPQFLDAWAEWYSHADVSPPSHLDNGRFEGYIHRRPNHVMKLSMIMSVSESSDMVMTDSHLERAIKILELTERNMPNTFEGVGQSDISVIIQKVLTYIKANGEVSFDILMRTFYSDADSYVMQKVIQTLTSMNFIQTIYNEGEPKIIKYIGEGLEGGK